MILYQLLHDRACAYNNLAMQRVPLEEMGHRALEDIGTPACMHAAVRVTQMDTCA